MSPDSPLRTLTDARKLMSTAVDRLPPRFQYVTREAARQVEPLARRAIQAPAASPLVSIVLPVYNVETYLPACLDSILSQSYRKLQVIAVDDGSPDDSISILRHYAGRDPRLQIVRQANAGLGAARNNGVPHAKGKFLMFMDSDDVLAPDAISNYVRSMRFSGSDFAVGLYQRVNASGTYPAAWWVRNAHKTGRPATTLAEFPEILVNAVAWSKFYRRKFWLENHLRFPEGVLYEDQAVSARAYAQAKTFDVINKITYQWRIRDDRTSITQQNVEVADLKARLDAAFNSLAELQVDGIGEAYQVRLAQLLSNDFPLSIKAAQHADDEFWQVLRDGLKRLTDGVDSDVWDRISAQHRLSIKLVADDRRDEVIEFSGLANNNPKSVPCVFEGGKAFAQFSAMEILELAPKDPMLALAEHQISLVTNISEVAWRPDGCMELRGWAYPDNIDLDAEPDGTGAGIVSIQLRNMDRPHETPVVIATTNTPDPGVTLASKHTYANYENGCFTAVIDPDDIGGGQRLGRWTVHVWVSAHGITRSGKLLGLQRTASPGRLTGRVVKGGRQMIPTYNGTDGLVITMTRPPCRLITAGLTGRRVEIEIAHSPGYTPLEMELLSERTKQKVRTTMRRNGNIATGALTIPETIRVPEPAPPGQPAPKRPAREYWQLRIVGANGHRVPLGIPDPSVLPEPTGSPRLRMTESGNVGVVIEDAVLMVQRVVAERDATGAEVLRVTGRGIGLAGLAIDFTLELPSGTVAGPVRLDGTAFEAVLPLTADPWGFGTRPLRSGLYRLGARERGTEDEKPSLGAGPKVDRRQSIPVQLDDVLLPSLPVQLETTDVRAELQLDAPQGLAVAIEPPLPAAERGARFQQQLQDGLSARLRSTDYERGAVLFRSYFGEIAGCNPLAVHEELRRRGTDHTLYWAVRDHSVAVPDGGIPVVYESSEWYRLLHDAEFYIDNMHQPIYHKKPAHQVQVQTFHGYPFKQMGLTHWTHQNRDLAHIKSYLERAADWDYLVSPASYGTEPLRTEFGFPNEMLEIGYPRNDVLQSDRAPAVRDEVRERLGIRPDQTAILYGPTFRDHMARNDFMASMVDFLDVDRLAGMLGDRYVVLVRGHAFNARLSDRVGSRGTIIDVTDYPDIAGLCLASDVAVLDYSSLRFDYALTGKPMIFMVPDLDVYVGQARGALFDFEPTAPGPLVSTTDLVAEKIADLRGVVKTYALDYATFRSTYLDLDDGHATERLVDRVFLR